MGEQHEGIKNAVGVIQVFTIGSQTVDIAVECNVRDFWKLYSETDRVFLLTAVWFDNGFARMRLEPGNGMMQIYDE